MYTTFNRPNWAYVVEVTNQDKEHLCFWVLEQYIERAHCETNRDKNATAVNKALHGYHRSTGCNYGVVFEGPPDKAREFERRSTKLEG